MAQETNTECFQYVQRLHPVEDVELEIGGEIRLRATCEPGTTDCYMCPDCGRLVDELECNGVCRLCEPTKMGPLQIPWQLFWYFYRLLRKQYIKLTGWDKKYPPTTSFTHWSPRGIHTPEYKVPDDD